jgi:Leucine-rich repeat (LRR) protein
MAYRTTPLSKLCLIASAASVFGLQIAMAQPPNSPPTEQPASTAVDTTATGEAEIAQAIQDLSSTSFAERESAQLTLVAASNLAIDALEIAAKTNSLEVTKRCVDVLVHIVQQEKSEAAIAALERLAKDPSFRIADDAARLVTELKMTDEERAEAKLTADGVRIGRDPSGQVFSLSLTRDSQLALLKYFPHLRSVDISGKEITNAGLKYLPDAKQLFSLSVMQCPIMDASLGRLAALPQLRSLNLRSDSLTSKGLSQLQHVASLKNLMLFSAVDESALSALVDVDQIDSLWLSNETISQLNCTALNQLKHLSRLHLSLSGISDEQLGWLSQVEVPLSLDVMNSPEVTDGGWKQLKDCRILSLSLANTPITDAGLAHVGSMRLLESLMISKVSISDSGVEQLRDLKALKLLSLRQTDVTDAGIAHLKELLPDLRHVTLGSGAAQRPVPQIDQLRFTTGPSNAISAHLQNRRLSAADVEQLKQKQDLDSLFLTFRGTIDDDLKLLVDVPIKGLVIDSKLVTDRGIEALEKHATLASLAIWSSSITDSALVSIGRIPSLTKLVIQKAPITDAGVRRLVERLSESNKLKSLDFYKCPKLTDASLEQIGQMTSLECLFLNNNLQLTSSILEEISKLSNLNRLEVDEIKLDETDLRLLKQLTKLETLGLSRGERDTSLTDRGMTYLGELHSLQSLTIESAQLTDDGIKHLTKLQQLKSLDLWGTKVTDRGVAEIANSFPNLTRLGLAETNVTDAAMGDVGKLTELEWLWLDDTRVGDAGISQLDQLTKLEHIYLNAANISSEGHLRFQRLHPATAIRLK